MTRRLTISTIATTCPRWNSALIAAPRYSWTRIAERFERLYLDMLASKQS